MDLGVAMRGTGVSFAAAIFLGSVALAAAQPAPSTSNPYLRLVPWEYQGLFPPGTSGYQWDFSCPPGRDCKIGGVIALPPGTTESFSYVLVDMTVGTQKRPVLFWWYPAGGAPTTNYTYGWFFPSPNADQIISIQGFVLDAAGMKQFQ
jgi:hypothetical protein